MRGSLIAAFWIALVGAGTNLLFWLAYWNFAAPTPEAFSCAGSAAYCKDAYDQFMGELQTEFYLAGPLLSLAIAMALFGATMLVGWYYQTCRQRLTGTTP